MINFGASQRHIKALITLFLSSLLASACSSERQNTKYFGKTKPPAGQALRYITGGEPESLDPQISTSQNDYRLHMALYEGLTEYDPKTMRPIPAVAERWSVNSDSTEFVFHLRKNARWSNGEPITAHDFVYTFQRGLSPELAARNAYLAYYILYAQGYNEAGMFVRDPRTGEFVAERDAEDTAEDTAEDAAGETERETEGLPLQPPNATSLLDSPLGGSNQSISRLVVAGDEKGRAKQIAAKPKLAELLAGKELVPVKAEDIGVEAVDDYTFRVMLSQSAPFFAGLIPHPFFRAVPRKAIEQHKDAWTLDSNNVASGPFKLQAWEPYHQIVVERNPAYWDVATVKLEKITFYPAQEATTLMNLYKAGEVDAITNHSVPAPWLDVIAPLRDYMDAPEAAIEFYAFNTTKPPTNDKRVRRALNMAIDKVALSKWKRVTKPLTAFTPEGIFPNYPQPKGDEFNVGQAKELLAEAGYRDNAGKFDATKFPVDKVELTYNPAGGNAQTAEFVQAQWKQNLGITIPLKSIESRTFFAVTAKLEYKGIARRNWTADYIDPFTFLSLLTEDGDSATGWTNPKYDRMLREANSTLDPAKRYQLLATAEAYMLAEQPVIPLYTAALNGMKKPYVKGLQPNPGSLHAWKFVRIEHNPAEWDKSASDMSE